MTTATQTAPPAQATEVTVPDIGNFDGVPIIEVHVSKGDQINADDPLITLESEKATMDVPSPGGGTVTEVLVEVGDEVSQGSPILMLAAGEGAMATPPSLVEQQEPAPDKPAPSVSTQDAPATGPASAPVHAAEAQGAPTPAAAGVGTSDGVHAGPSVRRTAREFGIDLGAVTPSGPKGRITKDDLLSFLRGPKEAAQQTAPAASGGGIPEIPAQDFSKFGTIRRQKLSRIKKVSAPFLHSSWLNIPHVTHNDEADITELDRYRKELDTAARAEPDPYRVTLLAFLVKACVSALRTFPEFNSSLSPDKDELIFKDYYNIGIAVDTPDGLVVPVVKDADRKGIIELSREFGVISARARDGKLAPSDMQGGTFTISSLGGIGGTSFTPIVNAPEVAILGVVRSAMKPVWNGTEFAPRLMLPVSLSYDHRVIDGALAARFARHLCHLLEDDRRLLL
jgi:pyruvate dehydrogenase E2 component (dihydrolipoamide acetyltransferase)